MKTSFEFLKSAFNYRLGKDSFWDNWSSCLSFGYSVFRLPFRYFTTDWADYELILNGLARPTRRVSSIGSYKDLNA